MAEQEVAQTAQDALKGLVSEAVRGAMTTMVQEASAREQAARQEAQRAASAKQEAQTLWDNPVTKTVLGDPGVQKVISEVNFTAQNAMDHTRFYLNNPQALAIEQEIERVAAAGRMNRDSAYTQVIGMHARKELDARAAAARASGEINVGQGGVARPDQFTNHPANKLTHMSTVEETRAALKGVSF